MSTEEGPVSFATVILLLVDTINFFLHRISRVRGH